MMSPLAMQVNGEYIEELINGYTTVGVTGRESLEIELDTYQIGKRDGEVYRGKRYKPRTLTVSFVIETEENFGNEFIEAHPTELDFYSSYDDYLYINSSGELIQCTIADFFDYILISKEEITYQEFDADPSIYFVEEDGMLRRVDPDDDDEYGNFDTFYIYKEGLKYYSANDNWAPSTELLGKLNTLNNILNVENAEFIFDDESNLYYIGTPTGQPEIQMAMGVATGSFQIYCADPFKYSVEEHVIDGFESIASNGVYLETDYAGTYPGKPIFDVDFYSNVTTDVDRYNRDDESAETENKVGDRGDCSVINILDDDNHELRFGYFKTDNDDTDNDVTQTLLLDELYKNKYAWNNTASKWSINHDNSMQLINNCFGTTNRHFYYGTGQSGYDSEVAMVPTSDGRELTKEFSSTSANFTTNEVRFVRSYTYETYKKVTKNKKTTYKISKTSKTFKKPKTPVKGFLLSSKTSPRIIYSVTYTAKRNAYTPTTVDVTFKITTHIYNYHGRIGTSKSHTIDYNKIPDKYSKGDKYIIKKRGSVSLNGVSRILEVGDVLVSKVNYEKGKYKKWSSSKKYTKGNHVIYERNGVWNVYEAKKTAKGSNQSPTNSNYWKKTRSNYVKKWKDFDITRTTLPYNHYLYGTIKYHPDDDSGDTVLENVVVKGNAKWYGEKYATTYYHSVNDYLTKEKTAKMSIPNIPMSQDVLEGYFSIKITPSNGKTVNGGTNSTGKLTEQKLYRPSINSVQTVTDDSYYLSLHQPGTYPLQTGYSTVMVGATITRTLGDSGTSYSLTESGAQAKFIFSHGKVDSTDKKTDTEYKQTGGIIFLLVGENEYHTNTIPTNKSSVISAVYIEKTNTTSDKGNVYLYGPGLKTATPKTIADIKLSSDNTIQSSTAKKTKNIFDRSYESKTDSENDNVAIYYSNGAIHINVGNNKSTYNLSREYAPKVKHIIIGFFGCNTRNLYWTGMEHLSMSGIAESVTTDAEVINKFLSGDKITIDTKDFSVKRSGIESQSLGALGNDWDDFKLTPGENSFFCTYDKTSDYKTFMRQCIDSEDYKPASYINCLDDIAYPFDSELVYYTKDNTSSYVKSFNRCSINDEYQNIVPYYTLSSGSYILEEDLDEETFNANKTDYYQPMYSDPGVEQCDFEDEYDSETLYFTLDSNGDYILADIDGSDFDDDPTLYYTASNPFYIYDNQDYVVPNKVIKYEDYINNPDLYFLKQDYSYTVATGLTKEIYDANPENYYITDYMYHINVDDVWTPIPGPTENEYLANPSAYAIKEFTSPKFKLRYREVYI